MFLSHESQSCVLVNGAALRRDMGKVSGQLWSVAGDRDWLAAELPCSSGAAEEQPQRDPGTGCSFTEPIGQTVLLWECFCSRVRDVALIP